MQDKEVLVGTNLSLTDVMKKECIILILDGLVLAMAIIRLKFSHLSMIYWAISSHWETTHQSKKWYAM